MFSSGDFFERMMPHGYCYAWQPGVLWLNVLSDAAIALAYFSIPITLIVFQRRRSDFPFNSVISLFSMFILACGFTHSMGIWTVWNGDYGVHGLVKSVTALVSVTTAIALVPVIPRALAFRSPAEYEAKNLALQKQVASRERAETRFRSFLESAPDATVIVDKAGAIKVVNAQAETLFGYHRDELVGSHVEFLIPKTFKEMHATLGRHNVDDPKRHPTDADKELQGVTKDGREIPVEMSLSSVGAPDEPLISAAIRDISERRRMEAQSRTLQLELTHVTRLSTMGEMATGLAHELNQPLTAITQYCDAAMSTSSEKGDSDPEITELLGDIHEQAHRAGEIIRQLRQFVRKGETEKSSTSLNQVVSQTVRMIEPDARDKNVQISLSLSENGAEVMLDRVQIAQVLVNLLRNCIEAIDLAESDQRIVTVTTRRNGETAVVTVRDTGPGLGSAMAAFEPFQSTKTTGLGMGLPISRSIIEAHGGRLWADETSGDGACLYFTLPLG